MAGDVIYTVGEHGQELIAPGPSWEGRHPSEDVIELWPITDDDSEAER